MSWFDPNHWLRARRASEGPADPGAAEHVAPDRTMPGGRGTRDHLCDDAHRRGGGGLPKPVPSVVVDAGEAKRCPGGNGNWFDPYQVLADFDRARDAAPAGNSVPACPLGLPSAHGGEATANRLDAPAVLAPSPDTCGADPDARAGTSATAQTGAEAVVAALTPAAVNILVDAQEQYVERRAIREFDGHQPRAYADRAALAEATEATGLAGETLPEVWAALLDCR